MKPCTHRMSGTCTVTNQCTWTWRMTLTLMQSSSSTLMPWVGAFLLIPITSITQTPTTAVDRSKENVCVVTLKAVWRNLWNVPFPLSPWEVGIGALRSADKCYIHTCHLCNKRGYFVVCRCGADEYPAVTFHVTGGYFVVCRCGTAAWWLPSCHLPCNRRNTGLLCLPGPYPRECCTAVHMGKYNQADRMNV